MNHPPDKNWPVSNDRWVIIHCREVDEDGAPLFWDDVWSRWEPFTSAATWPVPVVDLDLPEGGAWMPWDAAAKFVNP